MEFTLTTFTNLELRFLGQARNGMASLDPAAWASMPPHIRQRIAEHRAKMIGAEFEEFRALLRAGAPAVAKSESPNAINLF
jgi:hypothetical protein